MILSHTWFIFLCVARHFNGFAYGSVDWRAEISAETQGECFTVKMVTRTTCSRPGSSVWWCRAYRSLASDLPPALCRPLAKNSAHKPSLWPAHRHHFLWSFHKAFQDSMKQKKKHTHMHHKTPTKGCDFVLFYLKNTVLQSGISLTTIVASLLIFLVIFFNNYKATA